MLDCIGSMFELGRMGRGGRDASGILIGGEVGLRSGEVRM